MSVGGARQEFADYSMPNLLIVQEPFLHNKSPGIAWTRDFLCKASILCQAPPIHSPRHLPTELSTNSVAEIARERAA